MKSDLVLVTGGSGFVASHCILQLLAAGYPVRTTLRSDARKNELLAMLRGASVTNFQSLSFAYADLTDDAGWDDAVRDCAYVLHGATPISLEIPRAEEDVIRPAVDGTLRVLKAAHAAGVKRVVLTSSFAAVGYGLNPGPRPFNENDWTDISAPGLSAYVKSKAIAERAAWEYMKKDGAPMELTVINPMAIFGPLLGNRLSSGHMLLKPLVEGIQKRVPHIEFGIVDVRDVAELHLRAMVCPEAAGERFLALADGLMTFQEIAQTLRDNLGEEGKNISTKVIPTWLLRIAAHFNARARIVLPMVGQVRSCTNEKARSMLGWNPRPNQEAVIEAGKSIIRLARGTG